MGSICYINSNPATWSVVESKKKLKAEYGGEPLLEVSYGIFDDYPEGPQELTMYMRKSVYDMLISGRYTVAEDSKWRHKLILLDCNGRVVPPLGGAIY